MRRRFRTRLIFAAAFAGALITAGCNSVPRGSQKGPLYADPNPQDRDGKQFVDGQPAEPRPSEIQQLIARLESLESDNDHLKKQLSDQYMEAIALRRAQQEAQSKPAPAEAAAPTPQPAASVPPVATATTAASSETKTPSDANSLSREALFDALVQRIEDSKDPDQAKAMMLAAISIAGNKDQLDPELLDRLDPRTRENVVRFHQMLAVAFDELAGDSSKTLDRQDMIDKLDKVFGAQPLEIAALELCRRVDSFGVYEPFATTNFLAGRQNRVLVYVELENFMHEPQHDGSYEVRLEQSVELYDATGEATVWRQGPVELVDVSRNKRRDFFIVYPIDLPARLPAGAYRLKVRVADKHTGSICEQTLHSIRIVADEAMVAGGR